MCLQLQSPQILYGEFDNRSFVARKSLRVVVQFQQAIQRICVLGERYEPKAGRFWLILKFSGHVSMKITSK